MRDSQKKAQDKWLTDKKHIVICEELAKYIYIIGDKNYMKGSFLLAETLRDIYG